MRKAIVISKEPTTVELAIAYLEKMGFVVRGGVCEDDAVKLFQAMMAEVSSDIVVISADVIKACPEIKDHLRASRVLMLNSYCFGDHRFNPGTDWEEVLLPARLDEFREKVEKICV